ncbi:hypothetical protein C8Q76DRAFT_697916 [Earliella scabrosa]|nr:hypothetical protein C8Q76DRAFT_697916 [Earliella scabrosa]
MSSSAVPRSDDAAPVGSKSTELPVIAASLSHPATSAHNLPVPIDSTDEEDNTITNGRKKKRKAKKSKHVIKSKAAAVATGSVESTTGAKPSPSPLSPPSISTSAAAAPNETTVDDADDEGPAGSKPTKGKKKGKGGQRKPRFPWHLYEEHLWGLLNEMQLWRFLVHERGPFVGYVDEEMKLVVWNWFHNREQEVHKGGTGKVGARNAKLNKSPTIINKDFEETIDVSPIIKALKSRATAASTLWAHANPDLIAQEHPNASIGAWRSTVGRLFRELPKEERDRWFTLAKEKKARQEARTIGSSTSTQLLKNQATFPRLLGEVISSFIGFKPGRIGAAVIDACIGMRDENGIIHTHSFTAGMDKDAPRLEVFEGGPHLEEMQRLERYMEQYIPPNPVKRDAQLKYSDDGTPKLPALDFTWNFNHTTSIGVVPSR